MPGLSDTYELKMLNALLGDLYAAGAGIPATVYVALMNVTASDTTWGTEVSGGGYARVAVVQNATNWPAAAAAQKKNGVELAFPAASGNWTQANAVTIADHATNVAAANVYMYGNLGTAKTILSGETAKFAVNALVVTGD